MSAPPRTLAGRTRMDMYRLPSAREKPKHNFRRLGQRQRTCCIATVGRRAFASRAVWLFMAAALLCRGVSAVRAEEGLAPHDSQFPPTQAADARAEGTSGQGPPLRAAPMQLSGTEVQVLLAAEFPLSDAVQRLAAATVTVRISPPIEADSGQTAGERGDPAALPADSEPAARNAAGLEIVVCSGVAVARRLVVTFAAAPASARFRITLPGGGQAAAKPCVIDRYSGLTLLELHEGELAELQLADALPSAGSAVLSAAAAGIEPPAVSLGMLSAAGRRLRAAGLPPLVECDVQTTETSCGAAVVDARARLLGVIAATPAGGEGGWTYALPVSHVRRLVEAYRPDALVVLDRRRPSVGLSLAPGEAEGSVRVERVAAGGPAARAGVKVGDYVLAADGRKIRSAYQAVDLIVNKEPGEPLRLVLLRDGRELEVELVPASGMVRSSVAANSGTELRGIKLGPQLAARPLAGGAIRLSGRGHVAELALDGDERSSPGRIVTDEVTLLRKQLEAFEQVIERLQAELERRERFQAETQGLLEQLNQQVRELRAELERVRARERGSVSPEP